ncbi:MAG: hypothetical protein GY870_15550 [archaeon]|nr:hypothetical protein [archaeon]
MAALAYKSETIPPVNISKDIPTSDEGDLFDDCLELSETRINSFFKKPSVETEIDDPIHSDTMLSFTFEQDSLVELVHDNNYRQKTSVSSQKWKGYVIKKDNEYFTAIITDSSHNNPDEEVEIPLKMVSQDDLHLVTDGAYFDWHIGYERLSGTTRKYSTILFKRMPRWTAIDFEKATKLKYKFRKFLLKQPI